MWSVVYARCVRVCTFGTQQWLMYHECTRHAYWLLCIQLRMVYLDEVGTVRNSGIEVEVRTLILFARCSSLVRIVLESFKECHMHVNIDTWHASPGHLGVSAALNPLKAGLKLAGCLAGCCTVALSYLVDCVHECHGRSFTVSSEIQGFKLMHHHYSWSVHDFIASSSSNYIIMHSWVGPFFNGVLPLIRNLGHAMGLNIIWIIMSSSFNVTRTTWLIGNVWWHCLLM